KTGLTNNDTEVLGDDGELKYGLDYNYTIDKINKTITDNVNNLMWQDDENMSANWSISNNYCQDKSLNNFDNWRLPMINELDTIINYQRESNHFVNTNTFINHIANKYWTQSYKEDNILQEFIWTVRFDKAYTNTEINSSILYIKCVRDNL
ncbi:MAG: DUF1566 domain-containing protein, partial [Arcobacteraceae bacterium]|nr:DUF1566 domain-containing protein [Arcobacteraceae bacterium]